METVLGIDIGGTLIRCGLVNGKEVLKSLSRPTLADKSAEEIFSNLINCINDIISADVIAIGVGAPGLIDEDKGWILNTIHVPAWKDFPLKQRLEEYYKMPVFIDNDANCFVLGTKHFGKGQAYKSLVGVTLGTGVGGGIYLNNKLHSGMLCGAGEIGCMTYLNANFEQYCGSAFFTTYTGLTGKQVAQKAATGDESALKTMRDYGYHLGKLISNLIYVISPQAIILGGAISQSFPLFKSGLDAAMNEFPFKSISSQIDILPDHFDNIAILGAAGLYYNSL